MVPSSLASPPRATRLPPIPFSRARATLQTVEHQHRYQRRQLPRTAAVGEGGQGSEPEIAAPPPPSSSQPPPQKQPRRAADSTDPIASALTRRFGILGGLGWAAVLTFGVLSEQIKTRFEESEAERGTVAASGELAAPREVGRGVSVRDVRIGGGAPVAKGMLLILNVRARTIGKDESSSSESSSSSSSSEGSGSSSSSSSSSSSNYFVDTSAPGAKPLVLLFGTKLTGGLCPGAELALAGMRAGGRRIAVVPPAAGFGENGWTARPTEHVPEKSGEVGPGATLEYDIEVVRVSVPPS